MIFHKCELNCISKSMGLGSEVYIPLPEPLHETLFSFNGFNRKVAVERQKEKYFHLSNFFALVVH